MNEEQTNQTASERPDERTRKERYPIKLIRNNYYLTLCVYVFVLVVVCTIAIKMIFAFDSTKAQFAGLIKALAPFLIAVLIAYILTPFVHLVRKLLIRVFKRLSSSAAMIIAMLIVYLVALALLTALVFWIIPEVTKNIVDLVNFAPTAYKQLIDLLENLQERFPQVDLHSMLNMLQDAETNLTAILQNFTVNVLPVIYKTSVSLVNWLANFLIAIVASVYMLYGKESLKRLVKIFLHSFLPEEHYPIAAEVLRDCSRIFSKFVVSKMVDSLIIGLLCFILMTILSLPYALLISVFVAITNMIQYFGPVIGAIPGLIIQLAVHPFKALTFLIMILCLQQFDGLVLGPKLMGDSTGIKPFWIIFAVTMGGRFFGVVGMFLGVPAMAILVYLADRITKHQLRKKQIRLEDIP